MHTYYFTKKGEKMQGDNLFFKTMMTQMFKYIYFFTPSFSHDLYGFNLLKREI